jgi:phosphoribosyl 1,2-cyclic phosphate phosphodiesterase
MDKSLKITFLGTGTSQGVPIIACDCEICKSSDPRDKRLRTSVLINTGDKNIVIDTGPDFRQQMLTAKIKHLDAVLFTHEHKDHVAGLDDVRPFNFLHKKPVRIFAEDRVYEALKREYAYIFSKNPYPGVPEISINIINENNFFIDHIPVIPIRVMHYKLPILGFRIYNFAYLTDIKTIPESEINKLKNIDTLVITALRKEEHISHMNLEESLKFIEKIRPKRSYLIHLSHRFGKHAEEEPQLPENVHIAYDGLTIEVSPAN